ncbi:hypothetical protein C7974DRAFT_361655 [Boeremia exigua]|uniref:uncharacterized protein n=1 Tax=Boeremia exigua TaxID=749465 RepID=UPI001E8EB19B|nr:uncharacterized protein C7974DRAFT_361655 [Boeremia exigua]KAH6621750.1 hypothetical protein C7974DRAFT_361655 [Boeremia exigua]
MAAKLNMAAFGGAHTAGIFSDMTVDGPVIGTLVAIIDRARNLPNKRTMGKQDPYCAARLGKEAKKTQTDKRGGQTPRWDQELRFTVHDSPDYHRIKVSVFNDDRKTELIGDTFIGLTNVIHPGGGQSDGWHALDCRGKYAGEIRIEFTYYDIRPKAEKPAEKRREAQPEGASPPVSGPRGARGARESIPIKRRPLPSDPTVSPSTSVPEHRGLQGVRAGPRELGSPRHAQEPAPRRPVPEASPVEPAVPNPRSSNPSLVQPSSFDMSYAAPKPYEVKPVDALPRHLIDPAHPRPVSQEDLRAPRAPPVDALHAHSAPVVPTQHSYETDQRYASVQDPYDDPSYHVAPLRSSRSNLRNQEASPVEQYRPHSYVGDSYDESHSLRRQSAMQPTVEDEDFDLPPPPPAHRKNAATISHPHAYSPNPYASDAPAPLNFARHQDPPEMYDLQRQPYAAPELEYRQPAAPEFEYRQPAAPEIEYRQPTERRYTHPRAQSNSRPVSRGDAVAPSPLRHETSLPSALVAGFDPNRGQRDSYHAPPAYDTPPRLRQYSEPVEYHAPPEYTTPVQAHELVHYQAQPPQDSYYDHDPPEEPCRRSPVAEYAPVPRHSPNPIDDRGARTPTRSMPTRKSVSPRPPPADDRRLSTIPFGPDDFNVLNPQTKDDPPSRPGSRMEYTDAGQIVTFSGRTVDPSDHLPIDNWAPEPEPKGTVKEKNPRTRAVPGGTRSIQDAHAREERYRRDRAERERIAAAADTAFGGADNSQALVMTRRPDFDASSALVLADRDAYGGRPVSRGYESGRPVSRGYESTRPISRGYESTRPVSRGYEPSTRAREALRERHSPNAYADAYPASYGAGGRHAAPPIPAKIPLDRGVQNEDVALSLELQSIDIGPAGGGGRRPRTRGREYGAYV